MAGNLTGRIRKKRPRSNASDGSQSKHALGRRWSIKA
jgi:hypothetical protein